MNAQITKTNDQKRTRQKPKLSTSNMNTPQQYCKPNPANSANGSTHNLNNNNNNNQFIKSMDDWLNSNNNNCNNGNTNNDANRTSHLDEWLNATMKDSPKTFSVSSTEFLDGPTRNVINNTNGLGSMGIVMPPVNLLRMMPSEFQNQSNFAYVNNFETSPYFRAANFASPSASMKIPSHHSEFTSLPPAVNLNTDTNRSSSQNDLLDGLDNRRFSDPCLAANLEDETQNDGDKSNLKNQSDQNKLIATLIKQINILHETNSKICRNLNDTKIEIETLKHAPNWDLRNRRDSISGFSTHSQPLGYTFGAHSPAPTYHSGVYTPGCMTDVVREVKEAARIREEALLSRVRALVEERSWSMSESNLKMMRDLEEMKIQVNQLKSEKFEMKNQVSKLEDEVKTLKSIVSHLLNYNGNSNSSTPYNQSNQSTPFNVVDRNFLRQNSSTRPSLSPSDAQKRRSFPQKFNQDDDTELLRPIQQQFNELLKEDNLNFGRNNIAQQQQHPNDGIYANATNNESHESNFVQIEKDNLELRRELEDARASNKQADKKIQDLEYRLMKSLQTKSSQANDNNNVVTISTGSSAMRLNNNKSGNGGGVGSNINADDLAVGKQRITSTITSVAPKVMTNSNGTSTINLSGPVTDL
ncbi:myb-like protein D isoform X2 [Contarinia nasturtii]|uniref:myb-like protein D isoform X2 n=1 Tax=Contarinia nasturtii TaxID=265458 RepID=UPI0012D3966C|nr:myb-like protein D isoform X2 [Contarinia nasturtii]